MFNKGRILKTVGFYSPESFNADAHVEINERVAKYSQTHALRWRSFASGWNGLAHRFRSATESHKALTESVQRSSAPAPEERYIQELALFTFVVSAVSTVECFYYSMYCIGGIIVPNKFPMSKSKDLKFYPEKVSKLYIEEFPAEQHSISMASFLTDSQLIQLTELRNVLTHRGDIPRMHFGSTVRNIPSAIPSNPKELSQDWDFSLVLEPKIFDDYLKTISQNLDELMNLALDFTGRNV